jgi:hypothetical protein
LDGYCYNHFEKVCTKKLVGICIAKEDRKIEEKILFTDAVMIKTLFDMGYELVPMRGK